MKELNKIKELFDDFIKEADKFVSEQKKQRVKQTTEKTIYWGETADKEMKWEDAKEWCESQGGRLPTLVELLEAYENVDDFLASNYWSATEFLSTYAWSVHFNNDYPNFSNKTNAYYVRCVFDKLNK